MSMLRSKMGELWRRFVQKREMVGMDESLNKYFIWQQKDYKGDWQERREVQLFSPPKEMADYNPNAVPTEWRSWLAGHRRVPPSPEEAARLREYREMVQTNARKADQAAIAKEQQGTSSIGEGDAPNMGAFLRQLGDSVEDDREASKQGTKPSKKQPAQGEASGEGDSFKPGQWGGQ